MREVVRSVSSQMRASADRAGGNPNSKGNDTSEIENENASFMMASKDLCLSDECRSVS